MLDIGNRSILLEHLGHIAIDTLFEYKYEAHQKHDSQSRNVFV
jgi:hypothetical protein